MPKRRFVYDKAMDEMVEIGDDWINPSDFGRKSHQVMPDIEPYKSMIDGTLISSRSHHREHLKAHGCVEVGNDSSLFKKPQPLKPPPGLKQALIEAAHKHLRYK